MKKITRRESLLALASVMVTRSARAQAAFQGRSGSGARLPGNPVPTKAVNQNSQPSPTDRSFQLFVEDYFDGFFHFSPAQATACGIHKYDAELPAYSEADLAAEMARNRRALENLGKIASAKLSAVNQLDARLLESLIRGYLLDLSQIRWWIRDPNFYNDLASTALFTLVERDFAPIDDRLKSLIARERRVPEVLNSARANVTNPPAIATQVALEQVQAQINFLRNVLPQAIAGASESLKTEFDKVNQFVLDAYNQFLNYLRNELSASSHGGFAIGAANYGQSLLYDEMVDVPLQRLLRIGRREMRRTQSLFIQTAQIIDATRSPLQVFESLTQEHPDTNHLLAEIQSLLEELRQFVTTHGIVTIPAAPIPQVTETPPFMTALTFASMDSPGPLEQHSIQPYYYVTLPNPSWSEAAKEQLLRFFNRYTTRVVSIHEVYPGHYVQSLWLKGAPSRARKIEPSLCTVGTNSEGWAHYCEEMMLEQGYGEGDPRLLLIQLQASLIRLCRYITSIQMHTEGMTVGQAADFFQSEAYMEKSNAEREAMRGALDPTGLVYTLGKLMILKLRQDYKQKRGEKFVLRQFHDQFLSFGIVPIKMIREQMLGDHTPVL